MVGLLNCHTLTLAPPLAWLPEPPVEWGELIGVFAFKRDPRKSIAPRKCAMPMAANRLESATKIDTQGVDDAAQLGQFSEHAFMPVVPKYATSGAETRNCFKVQKHHMPEPCGLCEYRQLYEHTCV